MPITASPLAVVIHNAMSLKQPAQATAGAGSSHAAEGSSLWLRCPAATLTFCWSQMNTTLRNLELNGNGIEYDGMTALAEALMVNDALRGLHMR